MRLHEARKILSLSGITITEAAFKTGFKNISHFSQAFSREFGTPPSEVRK
jgi:transcriptional regulator GlxA family with amidase domain